MRLIEKARLNAPVRASEPEIRTQEASISLAAVLDRSSSIPGGMLFLLRVDSQCESLRLECLNHVCILRLVTR